MQGLIVDVNVLLRRYLPEIHHDIRNADAVEIVSLATGENGRKNLVLLRGRKNEYGVGRRLLQCLEEGVEGRLGQHVHLVDDIDTVPADLRRNLDLVHQCLDVVHTVVGGGIQLVDAI